jgi:hypothetical protein
MHLRARFLVPATGVFATTEIVECVGEYLHMSERNPETVAERFAAISGPSGARTIQSSFAQSMKFVRKAAEMENIDIS